jgi:predicted  nucleic acid-binding Zn-ribbon protein
MTDEKDLEKQETPETEPQETPEQQPQEQTPAPPDEQKVRSALAEGDDYGLPEMGNDQRSEEPEQPQQQEEQTPEETPEQPAQQTTEQPAETTLKTQPIWDKLRSEYEAQFGEGKFQMPEELTEENEYDTLMNFLSKTLEPDIEGLPDEAKEIIALHKEGKYNSEQYFSQKSLEYQDVTKLPDKDLLYNLYKARDGKSEQNPNGFTDDEIEEYLQKKSRIELKDMAQSARQQILKTREEKTKQVEAEQKAKYEQNFEKLQELRKKRASEVVNQFKNRNTIFGVEFTPQEKQDFDKQFYDMVSVNKETGMTKIAEMLQDDNLLYSVAAILYKGDLSGYITDVKEGVKKNFEQRLDRSLDKDKGSTKMAKPVDRSKLV